LVKPSIPPLSELVHSNSRTERLLMLKPYASQGLQVAVHARAKCAHVFAVMTLLARTDRQDGNLAVPHGQHMLHRLARTARVIDVDGRYPFDWIAVDGHEGYAALAQYHHGGLIFFQTEGQKAVHRRVDDGPPHAALERRHQHQRKPE
jgi:hypothetical protein